MNTHAHTLIHPAAETGDLDTLRACLAASVPVDLLNGDNDTPLECAVCKGQEEAVRLLLEAGANPNESHIIPLHCAVMWGTDRILQHLLEAGARTDRLATVDEETALYWAAETGRASKLAILLAHSKAEIAECSGEWPLLYPLHVAARNGHAEVVRLLLEAGADVNQLTEEGMSALHLCGEELIPLLLAAGAKVDAAGRCGWTPLHCAVLRNDVAAARLLLAAGAKVERHISRKQGYDNGKGTLAAPTAIIDPYGMNCEFYIPRRSTALHMAAARASADMVLLLLKAGADVHARTIHGETPLHLAARRGECRMVRLLLGAAAKPDAEDHAGNTPLHHALREGHAHVARQLIRAGARLPQSYGTPLLRAWYQEDAARFAAALQADAAKGTLQQADEYGNSLLTLAVRADDCEAVRALAQAGLNVNDCGGLDNHPLCLAVEADSAPMLELLLEHGADLQLLEDEGYSLFSLAACSESATVLPLLARLGLNFMLEDKFNETAAHYSIWRDTPETFFPALLAAGVNIHDRNSRGETALFILAERGSMPWEHDTRAWVAELIARGADVNAQDNCGRTPLHVLTSMRAPAERLEQLLAAGANPNLPDDWGNTPLHIAASEWQRNTHLLLAAGGDPNLRNKAGDTALHRAIKSYHCDANMRSLLAAGADANLRTAAGETALHLLIQKEGEYPIFAHLLLEHGADPQALTPEGKSALQLAEERGHAAYAAILRGVMQGA